MIIILLMIFLYKQNYIVDVSYVDLSNNLNFLKTDLFVKNL